MQTILAVIAVAGALVGMIFTTVLHRQAKPADEGGMPLGMLKPLILFALITALALLLCTVPASSPFAPGMRLGWGILIGAALGVYALFEAGRGRQDAEGTLNTIGMLSAAALGPGLVLLIFHGYPNEALSGCALGALLVAGIGAAMLRPLCAVAEREIDAGTAHGVETFALATTCAAVGARLAIAHFPRGAGGMQGGYWSLPALLIAVSALAFIVISGSWLNKWDIRWRPLVSGLIVSLIILIVLAPMQAKLLPALHWELAGMGLLAFGFVLAVLIRTEGLVTDFRPTALAFGFAMLAVLVAAIAFRVQRGYGEILALLAALPLVAALSLQTARDRAPLTASLGVGGFTVLLLLAIYRLFLERAGRGMALDFQQQYEMLAVLLGAGVVFALLGFTGDNLRHARKLLTGAKPNLAFLIARTVLLGVLLTGVPLLLMTLWGARGAGAFLVGLIVSEVIWMTLSSMNAGEMRVAMLATAPHVYLLGAALVTVQVARLLLALGISRTGKLIVLAVLIVAAIAWVILEASPGNAAQLTADTNSVAPGE